MGECKGCLGEDDCLGEAVATLYRCSRDEHVPVCATMLEFVRQCKMLTGSTVCNACGKSVSVCWTVRYTD